MKLKTLLIIFFIFLVLNNNGFSQEKDTSQKQYFIVLKDSSRFIGTFIKFDIETRTYHFRTLEGEEKLINLKDILYQKEIKDESDLNQIENYKIPGVTKIIQISSLICKKSYNIGKFLFINSIRLGNYLRKITKPYFIFSYFDNPKYSNELTNSQIHVQSESDTHGNFNEYFDYKRYDNSYRILNTNNLKMVNYDFSIGIKPIRYIGTQLDFLSPSESQIGMTYDWPCPIDFVSYYSIIDVNIKKNQLLPSIKLSKDFFKDKLEIYTRIGAILSNTKIKVKLTHKLENTLYQDGFTNERIIILDNQNINSKEFTYGFGFTYNIFKFISLNFEYILAESKNLYSYSTKLTDFSISPKYHDDKLEMVPYSDNTLPNSDFKYGISTSNQNFIRLGILISL